MEVSVVCIAAWILLISISHTLKYTLILLQLSSIFLNHIVYSMELNHKLYPVLYLQLFAVSVCSVSVYTMDSIYNTDQAVICIANVFLIYIVG